VGTVRIQSNQVVPTVSFFLEADVVETQPAPAGAGYGRWRIRFYRRMSKSSGQFFNDGGRQITYRNGTEIGRHEADPFLPSGITGWNEGPTDVWINANSAGYWSGSSTSYPLSMRLDYGSVDVTPTGSITLPRITQVPGVPTGVTATRVSDSQVNVAWTRNGFAATQIHVDQSVNGGAWVRVATVGNVGSAVVAAAANRKTIYRVRATNAAGQSAWSTSSAAVYTTPAAPSSAAGARSGLNVVLSWANNAAYAEYETVIEHGVNSGGIAWDGTFTVVPAGTTQWTDVSPDPGDVHVYRVRSRPVSATSLVSAWTQSNAVQLLTAPNAPTLANLPTRWTTDAALTVSWTHNTVDTTPQTAYELEKSTNGGSSWTSTGKITSSASSALISAGAYAADDAVTFRVRTWGDATTGGSEGTGASTWSTLDTVTYKTRSVLSITTPTHAEVIDAASVAVALSLTQAEGGTFVSAVVELLQASVVLETVPTTATSGILLATHLQDGANYQIRAAAVDSWGLASNTVTVDFSVDYAEPATPSVEAVYVDETGMITVTVEDLVADPVPVRVVISRTIAGLTETVADIAFTGDSISVIDTTPTIMGDNTYTVITYSAAGAASQSVVVTVTVAEVQWAYLSGGTGFSDFVRFYSHLNESTAPGQDVTLIRPAGRRLPIALFGDSSTLDVQISALVRHNEGSTVFEIEEFLRTCKRVCYRSPNGRRVFGVVRGDIAGNDGITAQLTLMVSEAS
jgi:hypothetical protein